MENSPLEYLRQAYFDKLEQDGIDYREYEDLGNEQTQCFVKDEFADRSIDDMIDYLELPTQIAFITKTACEYWETKNRTEKGNLAKYLFDMVYRWGQVGLVTDHNAPAFKATLRAITEGAI